MLREYGATLIVVAESCETHSTLVRDAGQMVGKRRVFVVVLPGRLIRVGDGYQVVAFVVEVVILTAQWIDDRTDMAVFVPGDGDGPSERTGYGFQHSLRIVGVSGFSTVRRPLGDETTIRVVMFYRAVPMDQPGSVFEEFEVVSTVRIADDLTAIDCPSLGSSRVTLDPYRLGGDMQALAERHCPTDAESIVTRICTVVGTHDCEAVDLEVGFDLVLIAVRRVTGVADATALTVLVDSTQALSVEEFAVLGTVRIAATPEAASARCL